MAKKKRINLNSFLKLSVENQINFIERGVRKLKPKLPSLKKYLALHNDSSDEMYNLTGEELEFESKTYIDALKSNEITTKSSKKAYSSFITNLDYFSRFSKKQIGVEYTEKRIDLWYNHLLTLGISEEEEDYLQELLDTISQDDLRKFTKTKYFLDVGVGSGGNIELKKIADEYGYNLPILKLELFMEEKGYETRKVYSSVKDYSDNFKVRSTRGKSKIYDKERVKAFK